MTHYFHTESGNTKTSRFFIASFLSFFEKRQRGNAGQSTPCGQRSISPCGRENNFGLLRLIFSILVIVTHSPELIDGNRSRELLTRVFGTLSLGECAVDGFFIISGYLITKSSIETGSMGRFLCKRIMRIFPGYLVCFSICYFLLAPLVGANQALSFAELKRAAHDMALLLPPDAAGAFHGLHYPVLNGSMWTINWEFRCYIAAALLGLAGLYNPKYRRLLFIGVAALLLLNALSSTYHDSASGIPKLRFAAVFGTGALYYLFRDKLIFTNAGAGVSLLSLAVFMNFKSFAELSFCIFGGYLIFWFAFKVSVLRISRLANKSDLSYGLYLYAWPVQSLIIWYYLDMNPWLLCGITVLCAGCIAYGSWTFVEKPSLSLLQRRRLAGKASAPAGYDATAGLEEALPSPQ